jgi:hypothetical protein
MFFYCPSLARMFYYFCSITSDLLPLGYYPEAISFASWLLLRTSESSTGRQRSFQPEPRRGVHQSDRVQLAFERILRNRLLGERLKGEEQLALLCTTLLSDFFVDVS